MSEPNLLNPAEFLRACHLPDQLPDDDGREVAFVGRSNAGKSSALNAICGRNGLARASKTPGRTQQLVYFEVRAQRYLVDMPGYGYAQAPLHLREHWHAFIDAYFRNRRSLVGLVVVMDSRHPEKDFDRQMIAYARDRGLPCHVLLSKADKLSRSGQVQVLTKVSRELGDAASVGLFSTTHKLGVDVARGVVTAWLQL